MLERVSLPGAQAKRVDQLSGGQKQRVAIARSLVLEPTLLLLDEPLGALDLKLREHMKIELKQLQAAFGTTFVYITHDQSEALVLSDRVAVMNRGRFEQVGLAAGAVLRAAHAVRRRFRRCQQPLRGPRHRRSRPARVTLTSEQRPRPARRGASAPIAVGDAVEAFVRPEVASLARDEAELPADLPRYHGQRRKPAVRRRQLGRAAARSQQPQRGPHRAAADRALRRSARRRDRRLRLRSAARGVLRRRRRAS